MRSFKKCVNKDESYAALRVISEMTQTAISQESLIISGLFFRGFEFPNTCIKYNTKSNHHLK